MEAEGIIKWKADIKTTNENGIYSYHWFDTEKYKNDLGKDINNIFAQIRVEVQQTYDKGIDYANNYIKRSIKCI